MTGKVDHNVNMLQHINYERYNWQCVFRSNDRFASRIVTVLNSVLVQFEHINSESNDTEATNGLAVKMEIAS